MWPRCWIWAMGKKLRGSGPDDAQIVIVQAYPEKMDVMESQHLASASGRFMKNALYKVGIKPSEVWYEYIVPEYPGYKGLDTIEAQDSSIKERPGLEKRIKALKNLKVVLLLGQEVAPEFGIPVTLDSARGYVWDKLKGFKVPVICTYSPNWLYRGRLAEEITFLNDLTKVLNIIKYGFSRPKEHFILFPTVDDVRRWRDNLKVVKTRLFVDIEAIGHLNNRDHNEITMIGIGRQDNGEVLVVPFRTKGGGYYWEFSESEIVRPLVKEILNDNPCVFHNAEYDVKHLRYQGFGPVQIGGDTMLLHHALHPELKHSLDYVTSIYGNLPYWKSTLKKAKSQLTIENEALRRYNARDCLATMQIENELIRENREQGTLHIYENISLGLLDVALEMNKNGIPVDAKKLSVWKNDLRRSNKDLLGNMFSLWPIHTDFNWSSSQNISYLFYGSLPGGYAKHKQEYSAYFQEGTKKKKNTKKFATLETYIKIYRDTKPFRKLTGLNIKMTDGGKEASDDEMRIRMLEACVLRSNALDKMKRPTEEHGLEKTDLEGMRKILESLIKYSANEKLLTTYTKLHIEPDGCVHAGFKIHGTKTGRLSSYSPNGQNLPYEAKKIFVAPPGWVFIQFDFTNLELVVLGYVAQIKHLIGIFQKGLNVHDENTKLFLGIDKTFKYWSDWRRVMKMYVFGRNYGGGLRGMHRRMLVEIPGLKMPYEKLQELDKNYFKLMPEYGDFVNETTDTIERTRTLHSCFGRIRIFLGPISAIIRQGLNFKIQSPAADIMSFGLIDFYKEYKRAKAKGLKMRLCLSVHDSTVLLAPKREVLVALKMLKRTMCAPRKIGEDGISFTGEVKVGKDYQFKGEEELNIDEMIEKYETIKKQKRRVS